MGKPELLDDSSDSDVELKINEDYAQAYDKWRKKEELQKLKDKYGDVSSTSSSSDTEDDEDPLVDKSFYKALSLVKSHDSKIYETNGPLLPDSEVPPKKPKQKKSKPMFLKDFERKVILETGGKLSDCEDELPPKKLPFNEEQELIRKSFTGFDLSEDEGDDDSSDILKVRDPTKAEKKKLEEDYIAYLKGDKTLAKEDQDEKKELGFLHDFWNDPKLSDNERFLRDYFLNAGYEEDDNSGEIPTYEDITKDVENESEEEVAAAFEHKYNFRFEEPDEEFIKRYPRTMKDSLRLENQKRKTKREEYAERKRLEKQQRREEIKRLKALKRQEIEEKLNLLKETLDDEDIPLQDIDIEGDFDPAEHDRKMSELFNDQYYDAPGEEEKPSFPEDEDLDFEDWDNWAGTDNVEDITNENYDGPHCEDPDFNMDADCEDPKLSFQREMVGATKQSKKKRKSQFAMVVNKKKPVFNPSDKSFEHYFDEYYRLDCEDFIGDLKTRFKYREVVPNDFGLCIDEILAADDKELNRWCSLKKVCQHRPMDEELYDVQAYQKKAQNEQKKKKIFVTLYNETSDENVDNPDQETKKMCKKDKPVSELNSGKGTVENSVVPSCSDVQPSEKKKRKKKKKRKGTPGEDMFTIPADQIAHDSEAASSMQNGSLNSSSFKNSKRKRMEEFPAGVEEDISCSGVSEVHKNKKRKHSKGKSGKFPPSNPESREFGKFSTAPKRKGENRHKAPDDKRLLLSDKRLEAYGIHPAKFKRKIQFSNK